MIFCACAKSRDLLKVYFYFRFVWPTELESIPHASTPTSIIPTKFEVWPYTAELQRFCLLIRHVTLWPWPLTFWPWTVAVHAGHVINLATKLEEPTSITGRLLSSVTNAKAIDCVNFLCVTVWPWPLTFDLLTLNSCHTWWVTCTTSPPSMKTLSLSVLELRVITVPID